MPLDFLVLAGLTRVEGAGLWDYVTAIAALAAFGWFLHRSSRILIEAPLDVAAPSALLVAGAMLVSAAGQLIAPAWLTHEAWKPGSVYVLTLVPVLAQVARWAGSCFGWAMSIR